MSTIPRLQLGPDGEIIETDEIELSLSREEIQKKLQSSGAFEKIRKLLLDELEERGVLSQSYENLLKQLPQERKLEEVAALSLVEQKQTLADIRQQLILYLYGSLILAHWYPATLRNSRSHFFY